MLRIEEETSSYKCGAHVLPSKTVENGLRTQNAKIWEPGNREVPVKLQAREGSHCL
jgi:hypothetical protein